MIGRLRGNIGFFAPYTMFNHHLPVLLTVLTGFLLLASVSPVLLAGYSGHWISALPIIMFSEVCHQIPERTPLIFGKLAAVCARCLGIYTFLFLGFIQMLIFRRILNQKFRYSKSFIIIAAIILAADVMMQGAGFYEGSNTGRFIIGAVLGTSTAIFIMNDNTIAVRRKNKFF